MHEEIKGCRICGSDYFEVLDLGELYPSAFVAGPNDHYLGSPSPGEKAPLTLVQCEKCDLVQLKHTVDLDSMYRQYWYLSGLNNSMVGELQNIVDEIQKRVDLRTGDVVIDIGANDGTMISMFPQRVTKIGVDPAYNLAEKLSKVCDYVVNDYFTASAIPKRYPKAKVITSIAMFYDLPNPVAFVNDITQLLDHDGIWVIQMSDLGSMLATNAFDNICFPAGTFIAGADRNIEDIEEGESVIGKDGRPERVSKVFKRAYQGSIVKINARYLEPLSCTPDHPILVLPKENYRFPSGQLKPDMLPEPIWKRAGDLCVGDALAVPRIESIFDEILIDLSPYNNLNSNWRRGLTDIQYDEELAWILGLYTAEGFPSDHGRTINFALHEDETDYINRISKFFDGLGYKTRVYPYKDNKAVNVQISCSALARAFVNWAGSGAKNKHIPWFIIQSSDNLRTSYLNGLISGDGWIDHNNKIELHTASYTLAMQTQLLFASLGVMVGICHTKQKNRSIKKSGYEIKSSDSWLVRGTSKDLSSIFDIDHDYNQKRLYFVTDRFIFTPIHTIEESDNSIDVYNLETKETHTYVASNAVVHNCHEHLEYYSLDVIADLLYKQGLEVFDISYNRVNGKSVRLYVSWIGHRKVKPEVKEALLWEQEYLKNGSQLQRFAERVERIKDIIQQFLCEHRDDIIFGMAASTKGNTLLQYFNIDEDDIPFIAEINPDKYGKYTVGSNIPIIPQNWIPGDLRYPDYYFVLAWHFKSGFIDNNIEFLKQGGKFIFPLPQPHIIYLENGEHKEEYLEPRK